MSKLFPHDPGDLDAITTDLLDQARQHGATDAAASVFENRAHSVHLRQGRIQALGSEVRCGLSLTVFIGHRQGSAHCTDLTNGSLAEMAKAACAIARNTEEDPFAGLPDRENLCCHPRELALLHEWLPESEELIELAHEIEAGMLPYTDSCSDGAWAAAAQSQVWLANSRGFGAGYKQSAHSLSARALAQRGAARNRDFWQRQERDHTKLPPASGIGAEAARRTMAALDPRPIKGGSYPVLFEARVAGTLLGHLAQAVSGRALYMKTSFLCDRFDSAILPPHISITEDPFIPGGKASAPFDSEGISGQYRHLVEKGILRGALLGQYSARRLGQRSTGNADGAYNLTMASERTHPTDDLPSMLGRLGTGLLVTNLAGDGVRLINGDYSRVAQGFWVEDGAILHAVEGVTIAGNLLDMWQQILAIGADTYTEGAFTTGAILIGNMRAAAQ